MSEVEKSGEDVNKGMQGKVDQIKKFMKLQMVMVKDELLREK